MMHVNRYIAEDRLLEKAIEILMKELVPLETMRFLSLLPQKRIDSVKRHHKLQSKFSKEKFFDEVFGS